MKTMTKMKIGAGLTAIFAAAGGLVYGMFNYAYSEGDRVGLQSKLSYKGFGCKSWEGELSMFGAGQQHGAVEDGVTNVFKYSVIDERVVKQIQSLAGKGVTLTYKEVPRALLCRNDERYIATGARENDAASGVPFPLVRPKR